MINAALSPLNFSHLYAQEGRIQIDNFLEAKVANQIFESFSELQQRDLWFQSSYGNPRYFKDGQSTGSDAGYGSYLFEKYPLSSYDLSSFSQSESRRTDFQKLKTLQRLPKNELATKHPLKNIAKFLNSSKCHRFISEVTQKKLSPSGAQLSATRYMPGDYCAAHDDGGPRRQVTFVLNLTKNWVVHWGGSLVILDKNWTEIVQSYTPKFNSLILFNVPLPHAVLPVSTFCQVPRYALSGWFHL